MHRSSGSHNVSRTLSASYFELKRLLKEVLNDVLGTKISNLYHMEDDSIILKLRSDRFSGELRIIPGRFFYLVKGSYEKPIKLSQRGKRLRTLIAGARIVGARIAEGERVMVMDLEKGGMRLKLISEFLPRGTIVVTDENGMILESLHHLSMKDRKITPGEIYKLPPPKPAPLPEHLKKIFEDFDPNKKIVVELAVKAGLGGRYAEEVLLLSGIDRKLKVKELDHDQKKRIIRAFGEVLRMIDNGSPMIAFHPDGSPYPLPYPLKIMELAGYELNPVKTFNEAVRMAYEHELARRIEEERRKFIEKRISELRKDIDEKRYVARRLISESDWMRGAAEKLFRIGFKLEEMKDMNGLHEIDDLKIEVDKPLKKMKIEIDGRELVFDLGKSIMKQISTLFDDAKKSMEAAEKLIREVDKLEFEVKNIRGKEVEEFEETLSKVSARMRMGEGRWYERYRWFISSEGFLVVAGKDVSSNRSLLKKHLDPEDLVFHAEVRGAAVVILKNGANAGESSRLEAAQFAAVFSRAWKEGLSQMTVYYVKADQISLTPPPGHYLPQGGFIVKGERRYLTVKLELAIGITDDLKLLYGPGKALEGKVRRMVRIVPGRRKAIDLAEDAVRMLSKDMKLSPRELRELRGHIAGLIPYGSGELVKI